MFWAEMIVVALAIYLGIGLLFALWFAAVGVTRLDRAAYGTGRVFRLIVFFGAAALWFWLAWRLARSSGRRAVEKNADRRRVAEV